MFSFHNLLYIILFNICSGHLFLVILLLFCFPFFYFVFICSVTIQFLIHSYILLQFYFFFLSLIFSCLNFSILLFLADHAVAGRVYVAVTYGPYTSTLIRVSPVCIVFVLCVYVELCVYVCEWCVLLWIVLCNVVWCVRCVVLSVLVCVVVCGMMNEINKS